jgi:hypothetical protein
LNETAHFLRAVHAETVSSLSRHYPMRSRYALQKKMNEIVSIHTSRYQIITSTS